MVEIWAKIGGTRHLIPDQPADYVKLKDYEPGTLVKVRIAKPRRSKHHRLYFGVIRAAFGNWPEQHPFQPDDPEHLRAWLQCKAGHRDIYGETLRADGSDALRMVEFNRRAMIKIRQAGGHGFFTEHNGAVVLLTPRSVKYDKLDEAEFSQVSKPVLDVIERETGIPIEALKDAAKSEGRMFTDAGEEIAVS
jgi:hypothetical protein